jgi:YD repeat-containing protein
MTDVANHRTLYFYDSLGRFTHTVNAEGEVQEQSYDIFGQVIKTTAYGKAIPAAALSTLSGGKNAIVASLSLTGGVDTSTSFYYDNSGRVRFVVDGAGQVQERNYTAFNQLKESISYTGKVDGNALPMLKGGDLATAGTDKLSSLSGGADQRTLFYYDNKGRLLQTVNSLGEFQGQSYDAFDRILTSTRSGNSMQSYAYNHNGAVIEMTVNGIRTLSTYNAFGQAVKTIQGTGADRITQTVYNAKGQVEAVIDPTGAVTAYEYDSGGRVVDQIRYAHALPGYASASDIGAAYRAAAVAGTLSDPGRDQHQRFIYDGNGDLSATLTAQTTVVSNDAQGNKMYAVKWSVQRQLRDGDGRVTGTIAYSLRMDSSTLTPSASTVQAWFQIADARTENDPAQLDNKPVDGGPVNDAATRYVYDGAGRVTAIATAQRRDGGAIQWSVVRQQYDARGNIAFRTLLATPLTATAPSDADIAGVPVSGADAITRYNYDGLNRVVLTATAQGPTAGDATPASTQQWALTRSEYDNFGNLSRHLQYGTLLLTNTPPDDLNTAVAANSLVDRATRYRYDALNRLAVTIDAAGAITRISYDVHGNAAQSIAYAEITTTPDLVTAAYNPAPKPEDRLTRTVYDLQRRPVYELDALGQVTEKSYDALGNMTSSIRYATALTSAQLATLATLGTAIAVADVKSKLAAPVAGIDRSERYTYDQDGRLRYTIDAAGYLKETVYTVLGQVAETRDYLQLPALALPAAPTMQQLDDAARTLLNAGYASVNRYSYDAAGNLIGSTDPQGATERYRYDGLGNKTGFTNKAGSVWTYAYDSAGRMVRETAPPAAAYTSGLNISMGNWGAGIQTALVTLLEYDALGNLTKRSEAAGTSSERVTSYRYDARGRQTQIILSSASVYDDAADAKTSEGKAPRQETLVARVTTIGYNAFGDAVSNRDVDGQFSYKVYDQHGQVAYDIDALGYVTSYTRTAFGEVKTLTRFNDKPAPLAAGKTLTTVSASDFALCIKRNAAADRSINTRYDLLGRVTKVSEPITDLFDQHAIASSYVTGAGKTTDTAYTAFGEVSRTTVYGANSAGTRVTEGSDTRYYYDARGNRRTRIDVLTSAADERSGTGYVTSYDYTFDAASKTSVVTTHEYVSLDNWDAMQAGGGALPGALAGDHTTRAVYDMSNRLVREIRVGVSYVSNGVQTSGDIATSYGYDVLGRQNSVTDALGGTVYTYYDVLGRTIAVAKVQAPGFTEIGSAGSPLTEFKLDILGNTVYRIDYADGALGAIDAAGYTTPGAAALTNKDNRVSASRYDNDGHVVEMLDAEQFARQSAMGVAGASIQTSYDIYGRMAKQWRTVTSAGRPQTAFAITRYDALGRVSETETPGNENLVTSATTQRVRKSNAYNAFGELVNTYLAVGNDARLDIAQRQELSRTKYDQAGHAWYSNAADGVDTISLYDALGNATAQIRGTGSDVHELAGLNNAMKAVTVVDQLRTDTRYDRLGHVVDSRQIDDTRLIVIKRINGVWTRVRLDAGQSASDSLVLVGDSNDSSNAVTVKYRQVGTANWNFTSAGRLQWLGENLAFGTEGLASGTYEYVVVVTPPGEATFERNGGTLLVSAGVDTTKAAHVAQLFRLLFNRAPDVDSVNFWIAAYNEGRSETQVIQLMLLSAEAAGLALAADGSNAYGIIEAIYRNAFELTDLTTPARQAEIRGWAAKYAAGSVSGMDNRAETLADLLSEVMGFGGPAAIKMANWSKDVVDGYTTYNNRVQIIRIYITLFGRAPEKTGIDWWLNAMRQGLTAEGVANGLLTSAEGVQPWLYPTAGLTPAQINQQLVNHIYLAMLGRAPTAAENTAWLLKLSSGTTASQLAVEIGNKIADSVPTDAQGIADKALLNNKVALAFAAGVSVGAELDADAGAALLAGVTSAATAKEAADKALLALKAAADAAKLATPATAIAAGALPLEDMQRIVTRLYVVLLNRGPDSAGLDFYLNNDKVKSGQWATVAQGFLDSDEAKVVLGNWSALSDKDFVAKIYASALGQAPTSLSAQAEMEKFTIQLASGTSRAKIAFDIATGILEQASLSDGDKALKTVFNNKVAVGMTVAVSLGVIKGDMLRAMLALVTASDMKAAIDYAYSYTQTQLGSSQSAASAATIADNISKAAIASAAAATAATTLATRPTAVARLQLIQMYVGLLGRSAATFTTAPDVKAINEYVALVAGGTPLATIAQYFISSPEGKLIYDAGLSNEDFVARVYQQILGGSGMAPQEELNTWVQQLNAQPALARGKVALDILNSVLGYANAAPDAAAVKYLNAKSAFSARVVSAFAVVDAATVTEQTQATTLRNTLKSAADTLATALAGLKTTMTSTTTTKQNALNTATTTQATANAAGDGKGYLRLQLTQLYASVLQRTTPPSMVNEIDFYLYSPDYKDLTPAQMLERTAQYMVVSEQGRQIYGTGVSSGTDAGYRAFVTKLYSTIFGRMPGPDDNVEERVTTLRNDTSPYALGRMVMDMLNAQGLYSDGTLAQLTYKKTFDQKVGTFLTAMNTEATAVLNAAKSLRDQEAALAAAVTAAQNSKTQLDAAAVAPALLQGVTDANIILNQPNRRAVVELYSALRNTYDMSGVAFQMNALRLGTTSLDNTSGRSIMGDLLGADYPADDTAFVTRLYAKVLGNSNPPAADVQWHVDNELHAGYNRVQVARAFIVAAHRDIEPAFAARTTQLENGVINDAYNALNAKTTADSRAQQAAVTLQNARTAYANFGYTAAQLAAKVTAAQAVVNSTTSNVTANTNVVTADTAVYNATDATNKYNAKLAEWTTAAAALQKQELALTALQSAVADGTSVKASAKAAADVASYSASAGTTYAGDTVAGRTHSITELFFGLLNVKPTRAQLQFELDRMARGATLAEVANDIINSTDAKTRNLYPATMTNAAFITQLYSYALGRGFTNDPTGLAFWTKELVEHSRAEVAAMFIAGINKVGNNDTRVLNDKTAVALKALSTAAVTAAEVDAYVLLNNDANRATAAANDAAAAAALTASSDAGYITQVTRLYLAVLNRVPDAGGVRFWLAYLRANANALPAVAKSMILDSDEGKLLYPAAQTNNAFITQVFTQGMGRAPTTAELSKYAAQFPAQHRGQVALNIINDILATGASNSLPVLATRTLFLNKVESALSIIAADAAKYEKTLQSTLQVINDAIAKGVSTTLPTAPLVNAIGTQASGARVAFDSTRFSVDRWGNVLSLTDLRNPNWKIIYQYNYNNQLIDQTFNALVDTGGVPHSAIGYDALGRQVLTTDYNGNTNSQAYDANGNVVAENHADGGAVTSTYNLFGERLSIKRWDSATTGVQMNYAYDHLGHLTSTQTAAAVVVWVGVNTGYSMDLDKQSARQLEERFEYDELGRKVRSIDAAGISTYSEYDLDGNIIATMTQGNLYRTVTAYDAFHHRTATLDALNHKMRWAVDSFGKVSQLTDMSGAVTDYSYDAAGRLTLTSIKGSSVSQTYENGLLVRIVNSESGLTTTYTYDAAGNRLSEKQTYAGNSPSVPERVQNNRLKYDMQNRLTDVQDDLYTLKYTYDNNGNRTSIATTYPGAATFTKYNAYDEMNRQTIVNADSWDALQKKAVLGKTGHQIVYDKAGNRVSDSYIGVFINKTNFATTGNTLTTETYAYDGAGRLQYSYRDGVLFDSRIYDAAGRITVAGEVVKASDPSRRATYAAGIASQRRTFSYDIGGHVTRQQNFNYDDPDQDIYFVGDQWNTKGGYDAMGNLTGYTVVVSGTDRSDNGTYQIEYQWTDSAREKATKLTSNNTTVTSVYDNFGNRIQVIGEKGQLQKQFWYDADGHVQSKLDDGKAAFSLIVNGQVLGDENKRDDNILGSAYEPASASSLQAAPSAYSVQSNNETLQGIAQTIWGDAKLWYLIADANGLSSDSALKVGDILRIPTRINTVHNDYATFKPYNASDAIGNTAPALPPPSHSGGCGGVGTLIMVVVAVAVTVLTSGAAAAWLAGSMPTLFAVGGVAALGASTAGVMVGAAIGGALGSIASQAVGIAIGAQDSFNWKGVALSAIGSGVAAGVGSFADGLTDTSILGAGKELSFTQIAARAAVSNTISQGVGIVTGLQNGFSWAKVGTAYVSAYAGAFSGDQMAGALNGKDNMLATILGNNQQLAVRTVSGFAAGATASILHGGRIDVAQIATDAFGNAIGSSLVPSGGTTNAQTNATAEQRFASLGSAIPNNPYGQMLADNLESGAQADFVTNDQLRVLADAADQNGGVLPRANDLAPSPEITVDDLMMQRVIITGKRPSAQASTGTPPNGLLTQDQLQRIVQSKYPKATAANIARYLPALNSRLSEYNMTSPKRIGAFIGQVAVETGGFSSITEGLTYKTEGRLRTVFPSLFPTLDSEKPYLGQPEKLANYVYANRYGNGDANTGDGWSYRGSGLLHITFKDNYERIGNEIGIDLAGNPGLLRSDPDTAVRASLQFWKDRNLNRFADNGDYRSLTGIINAGRLDFATRVAITQEAIKVLTQKQGTK